jgi:inner membrane protein involved in colicin E2 resistance
MKEKPSDEFREFDRVMGGLLAVPYSELQRKLAEEKRTKAKQKKRRTTSPASRVSSSGKKRAA